MSFWEIQPSSFWEMTPFEWWLIYDSKVNSNKSNCGGADLSDEDIEELSDMIKESDV